MWVVRPEGARPTRGPAPPSTQPVRPDQRGELCGPAPTPLVACTVKKYVVRRARFRTTQLRPVPVAVHVPTTVLLTSLVNARTVYCVIADPPSEVGGVQLICMRPPPGTPPVIVGAPGIDVPVVEADITADSGLEPITFVASTVNQYCVLMLSPMTVHVRAPVVVQAPIGVGLGTMPVGFDE